MSDHRPEAGSRPPVKTELTSPSLNGLDYQLVKWLVMSCRPQYLQFRDYLRCPCVSATDHLRPSYRTQRARPVWGDPSFVSYRHAAGCRRSPRNLASFVTRLIGECRISLWSMVVVSTYPCGPAHSQANGSGGGSSSGVLRVQITSQSDARSTSGPRRSGPHGRATTG